MARARLNTEWTDAAGTTHPAGTVIDVDDEIMASLVRDGIATEEPDDQPDRGWVGPTVRGEDDVPGETRERGWVGPTFRGEDAAARDIDDTDR